MKKIAIVLIILMMCVACQGGALDKAISDNMESFMQAMKEADFEKVKSLSYMGEMEPIANENGELIEIPENGDLPQEGEEIEWHKKFFYNLSWELGEIVIDGDSATMDVVIKNKRVPEAFQKSLIQAYMVSQEEGELTPERSFELINNSLSENLESVDDVKTSLNVKFEKREGKWLIERDDKIMLALYGNDSPPPQDQPIEEGEESETPEETSVETTKP